MARGPIKRLLPILPTIVSFRKGCRNSRLSTTLADPYFRQARLELGCERPSQAADREVRRSDRTIAKGPSRWSADNSKSHSRGPLPQRPGAIARPARHAGTRFPTKEVHMLRKFYL